jgi:acetylglutamate kinase
VIPELGFVGEPRPSSPPAVQAALASGRIPVIAPLARGPLNVNADEAAWALAVGLGAERLLFHTDVPGVFAEGALLPSIEVDEADRMLEDGSFEGGIVPKLHAAVRAVRSGVHAEIGETVVLP